MISLTKAQVPDYLVGSEFYNSLSSDDDEEFSIPEECLKPTVSVSTAFELKHILNTLRFWGVFKLPHEIIELIIFKSCHVSKVDRVAFSTVLLEFDQEFKLFRLHKDLPACTDKEMRLEAALSCAREDVLEYVYLVDGMITPELIKTAAENGHFHLLQRVTTSYLLRRQRPFMMVSMATVARRGFSNCLLYLFENGCILDNKSIAMDAAANGHLGCLMVAHAHKCEMNTSVGYAAAVNGHLSCLKYVHKHGDVVNGETANAAAFGGQHECLQYVLDHGVTPTSSTSEFACKGGSLFCLRLLRESGASLSILCARAATEGGHLACLEYLLAYNCPVNSTVTLEAADKGHADCLNLLLDVGCHVRCNSVDKAAAGGHVSCLRILNRHDVLIDKRKLREAASSCHCEMSNIRYISSLFEAGYTIPPQALSSAVNFHNTAWVKFLCENRCCALEANLTILAVSCLPILNILHEYGCPWDERTCAAAAKHADVFECLLYAHKHGCPWDAVTATTAARSGCWITLTYAVVNGCPCDSNTFLAAAERGYLPALQLLHQYGCPWDEHVTNELVFTGEMLCLRYCVENGCPVDAYTCLVAVWRNNLPALQLLHEHGCPWDERVSQAAATRNNVAILRYCVEHGCPISKGTMLGYNQI